MSKARSPLTAPVLVLLSMHFFVRSAAPQHFEGRSFHAAHFDLIVRFPLLSYLYVKKKRNSNMRGITYKCAHLCAHLIKLFFNNNVELEILMQLTSWHQRSVLRDLKTKRPAALRYWRVCLQSPVQRLRVFPLDLGGRLSHLFQWTSAGWPRRQTLLHYQLFSSPTLGAFAGLQRDPALTPMRVGWKFASVSVPVRGSAWSTGCWIVCSLLSL